MAATDDGCDAFQSNQPDCEEDGDIPRDFEPGAAKQSILLSVEPSEEVENDSSPEYPIHGDVRRKGSTISEIGKQLVNEDDKPGHTIEATPTVAEEVIDDTSEQLEDLTTDSVEEDATSEERAEDVTSMEWKLQKKHIFVLSEAGKPVYSRHGSEDKLVTLMGVMQALISFIQDNGDAIRSIHVGQHKFVFLVRLPLILVVVSTTNASVPQLTMQLNYVYNQILSVLTATQLQGIFEKRRNYDLRRLLGGSERFIDRLVDSMDEDPSFVLMAVRCLPLDNSVRETIAQTIVQQCSKLKNVVFAILVVGYQLVTLARMKKYTLYPSDLHLVMNLVSASDAFKGAESWTPICLPRFDSSGFLHGHVSYLDDKSPACLLLLTVDRDMFFTLQECRKKIVERLKRHNCLQAISASLKVDGYSVSEVGIPDLRHFLYKSKSTAQFSSPRLETPYAREEDKERLYGLYQQLHHRMYNTARPLKVLYFVSERETMLGWHMPGFELYTAFDPLVTKMSAMSAMNKLVRWIKKEEERLFIMNPPTF